MGVGCTAIFSVTELPLFAVIGLLCVPVGVILCVVGLAKVGAATTGPRALLFVLLLSNFPLAYACWRTAIHFSRSFGVEVFVLNRSDDPIDAAVVTYNDSVGSSFGGVRPGGRSRIKVRMGSGERADVVLTVHRGSASRRRVIGNYDWDDLISGRSITVIVSNDDVRRVYE